MRDAAILLILILAVWSIRITPAEDVTGLVPAAHAAAVESSAEAEPVAPAIHSSSSSCSRERESRPLPTVEPSPPPSSDEAHSLQVSGERDGRMMLLRIELKRDRSLEAVSESSPIDPDRPREAPAAGAAC